MELVNNVVVTNLINENKVQITWDLSTNTDFTKYAIYRSACSYSTFVKIAEVPKTQNSYDDIPIEDMPINEWYYKVAQINEEEQEGPVPNEGVLFTNYNAFDVPRIVGPFQTPLPTDQDMKFYFNEIRSRNLWLLQNDGEPMILLKRKYSGTPCPCVDDADGSDQCSDPLNKETPCYATNYLGGYYPAINIMIRRWNQPRTVPTNTVGFELDMNPTLWTIYSPRITEGDILIDGMNRRWEIHETHNYHWRELITHQTFQAMLKKPTDIIYKIPIISYKYWGDEYWGTGFYGNQLV
jgi:hypothetical protein